MSIYLSIDLSISISNEKPSLKLALSEGRSRGNIES